MDENYYQEWIGVVSERTSSTKSGKMMKRLISVMSKNQLLLVVPVEFRINVRAQVQLSFRYLPWYEFAGSTGATVHAE